MRILIAALPLALLAACDAEPDADDAAVAIPAEELPAGDGGAPEMANVQAALDEACVERYDVVTAQCAAIGLGEEFECEYKAEPADPEDASRTITLVQDGLDWKAAEAPDYCTPENG